MSDEHLRDAERKRHARSEKRVVLIPRVADLARRTRLEADVREWLWYYFGDGCSDDIEAFTYRFTPQQDRMIETISQAIANGGDKALAATRGEGKTTITRRTLTYYHLIGGLFFSLIFRANGGLAEDFLADMKFELTVNNRLAEDYPEVIVPIRAVKGQPALAKAQIVSGTDEKTGKAYIKHQSEFEWSGNGITFPHVPGSAAASSCVKALGLDSAVLGVTHHGRRPQFALIDDPDTEQSARSPTQTDSIVRTIDRSIGGLGSQRKRIARVMLTTIRNKSSASALFTDPAKKPSWRGERMRFLIKPPSAIDLWGQYVLLYQDDFRCGTNQAEAFYLSNRVAMDAGAEVSNPHRRNPGEHSALQSYYNEMAIKGPGFVAAEWDNEPIEEDQVENESIAWQPICKRVNGFKKRWVPDDYIITMGVDIGKWRLHYVAKAFRLDGRFPLTIDYGEVKTFGVQQGADDGLDEAILEALGTIRDLHVAPGFDTDSGKVFARRILVDTRYRSETIVAFCLANPGWEPIAGHGASHGTVTRTFTEATRHTKTRRSTGIGWWREKRQYAHQRYWHTACDADHFKRWEQDRWMTPVRTGTNLNPRALTLWGSGDPNQERLVGDELLHREYAQHICSEREISKGVWIPTGPNHMLDASVYADVAAAIEGVPMAGDFSGQGPPVPGARIKGAKKRSMAEMRAAAKGTR